MQSDWPKTINEALKILAYNDYFWPDHRTNHINPHPKDRETGEEGPPALELRGAPSPQALHVPSQEHQP